MVFENVIKNHWETIIVKLDIVSYFWLGGSNKYQNQHIPYNFWGHFCAAK